MESKQQLLEILSRLEQGKYKYLSELFRYVPNDVVKSISYKEIDKNQYLIQAENPCDMVYIILSGNVIGVGYPKTGQAYCFMDFTQTHIVGDFEVFANVSQYTSSVKTVDVCKVLVIPATYYLEWIKHDENAMYLRLQNIMSIVVLEKKDERKWLFMTCKERVVEYLIQSYEKKNKNHSDIYMISNTQTELADRIGFNLRSVQRCVAGLVKENLISIKGGKIFISHEQFMRLKQYVDDK